MKVPYNVVYTWDVQVWADDADDAINEADLYGGDEAGLGDAFGALREMGGLIVERIDDNEVYPRMFINEEV